MNSHQISENEVDSMEYSNTTPNKSLASTRLTLKSNSSKVGRSKSPMKTTYSRSTTRTPVRIRGDREVSPMQQRLSPQRTNQVLSKSTSSPKPEQKKSPRQQKMDFQGPGIIDRKQNQNETTVVHVDEFKINKMKEERRRKSIQIMRNSAQSSQIRSMLRETFEECQANNNVEDVEDRLKAILSKAKESGMTTEQIFSFFNGGNPNTTEISKEAFLLAIQKFGQFTVSEEELNELVRKFDKDHDNQISIAEFQHYCYHDINSMAWKAERTRLEQNGEMDKLKAQLSRQFDGKVVDENSCGNEVFRNSKLFWKTNDTIEIRYFFTMRLNIITMQLYSQTLEMELPCLYICKAKVDQELMSRNKSQEFRTGDIEGNYWETIGKMLSERLKMYEPGQNTTIPTDLPQNECSHIPKDARMFPYLCKLSSDTMETLQIVKPVNMIPPSPISSNSSISARFDKKMESFVKSTRMCRTSRKSAQGLSDILSSVLCEVKSSLEKL